MATVTLAKACRVDEFGEIWFADNASAIGELKALLILWNELPRVGPIYGYYPNAAKTWLVVKVDHIEEAHQLFKNTGIQISTEG